MTERAAKATARKAAQPVAGEISIDLSDLTAIVDGVQAIEDASNGMFALDSAALGLTADKIKVTATYGGGINGWHLTLRQET